MKDKHPTLYYLPRNITGLDTYILFLAKRFHKIVFFLISSQTLENLLSPKKISCNVMPFHLLTIFAEFHHTILLCYLHIKYSKTKKQHFQKYSILNWCTLINHMEIMAIMFICLSAVKCVKCSHLMWMRIWGACLEQWWNGMAG